MFTIKKYVVAESLEEAYKLNQSRKANILGGLLWMKMGKKTIQTAIDLSNLGLDKIEEKEDSFEIGAMATLRDIEIHKGLNEYFDDCIKDSVKNIVGVQFRNCATVGGSIFSRFGFSDVLTCFLALDSYVKLYKAGLVSMSEFVNMPYDNDILEKVIIKKDGRKAKYLSHRNITTDFPVLACCVSELDGKYQASIGATPQKAKLVVDEEGILGKEMTKEDIEKFSEYVQKNTTFGTNMRASKEFRAHLCKVLVRRCVEAIGGM